MAIHNADIAAQFRRTAELLEIEGANPFRVRAYRRAAATIEDLPTLGTCPAGKFAIRFPVHSHWALIHVKWRPAHRRFYPRAVHAGARGSAKKGRTSCRRSQNSAFTTFSRLRRSPPQQVGSWSGEVQRADHKLSGRHPRAADPAPVWVDLHGRPPDRDATTQ